LKLSTILLFAEFRLRLPEDALVHGTRTGTGTLTEIGATLDAMIEEDEGAEEAVADVTSKIIITGQALQRQWFTGVRPGVLGGNEPRAAPYDN
jgi:hypothetical protein